MNDGYLNGEFSPVEECKISVLDRGFIFGDSVYELIPIYKRQPFRVGPHIARLQRSLKEIRIIDSKGATSWLELIQQLVENVDYEDSFVYIQVTRGVAPRDHAFPKDTAPTVFAMIRPLPVIQESVYANGLRASLVDDIRWDRCDIKVTSLLANIMQKQSAIDEGSDEAIFVRNEKILEGSASNIFALVDDVIYTAPRDHLILPGIAREVVVEVIQEQALNFVEQPCDVSKVAQLQELWMTSSTKEVLPITSLNGHSVGTGKPGPVWKQVFDAYQSKKMASHGE